MLFQYGALTTATVPPMLAFHTERPGCPFDPYPFDHTGETLCRYHKMTDGTTNSDSSQTPTHKPGNTQTAPE